MSWEQEEGIVSLENKNFIQFDYSILDPGIRELVKVLHELGYHTTDSGDGVSKPTADPTLIMYDDYLPYPHVNIRSPTPEVALSQVRNLVSELGSHGNLNKEIQSGDISLQYDPVDNTTLILITNLMFL